MIRATVHKIVRRESRSPNPFVMKTWLLPYDFSSFHSSKEKEAILHDLQRISRLRSHWSIACLLGSVGQLTGDFQGNRFTLVRKRLFRNAYFPLARVTVQEADGGSAVEIRYSCPLFYGVVAICFLVELSSVLHGNRDAAVLMPAAWCVGHAIGCFAFQSDKEELESQIRAVL
jgi:hypothetical protein